ncbi:MAG: zinc-binding alcohol dehydrogenase family protein [Flavobacteriales bacterium]
MKAAVLHAFGEAPRYEEFAEPVAQENEEVLEVKAASLKNIDRGLARGAHYDSHSQLPTIVGVDGLAVMSGGTRVYCGAPHAPYGMMAERVPIGKRYRFPVPDGVDDATAAALPNAAMSGWLALSERAELLAGETVLVMGATGVSGKLAVRIAKHLGAGRVVAAGRNVKVLEQLWDHGADAILPLQEEPERMSRAFLAEKGDGYDVVLDYIWGAPMEVLLHALTGHDLEGAPYRTRIVQVGDMAGRSIQLAAGTLRSSAIELMGSGGGSVSPSAMAAVIPKIFALAEQGILTIDTEVLPLSDVQAAWDRPLQSGRRIVFVP